MEKKVGKKNIYVLYTVFFIGIVFITFSPFLLRGNGLVSKADGYNQVFPIFVYIRDYIQNIMEGNSVQFDFRIGLGDDVIYTLNYYGLFDIISIVSIFLFPVENIEMAYYFCVIVKLYFCGAAFICYARKYVKVREFLLVGSLLYTFNIYTLFWGIYFTPFLLVTITCPIIIKGIDEIIDGKKYSLVMIAALFIQGLNGFYHLYMDILIAIIYFILIAIFRLWKEQHCTWKQILERGFSIALNGILGVSLSGVILIPSIIGLFTSTRQTDSGGGIDLFCGWEYFLNSFGDLVIPNVYNSITTLSLLAVGGTIVFMFAKKVKEEFKYLGLGLWVLVWCPLMGSIMNGFSYSTDRWFFVVTLFTSMMTIMALQERKEMHQVEILLLYHHYLYTGKIVIELWEILFVWDFFYLWL